MTFLVDMAVLLARAQKRAAEDGYPATPATRLPESAAEGSQVATVSGYPGSEQQDTDDRRFCLDCLKYRPAVHICRNHQAALLQGMDIAPELARLLQRCPGWKGKA